MNETDPPAARTAVMSSRQHLQPAERAVVPNFRVFFQPFFRTSKFLLRECLSLNFLFIVFKYWNTVSTFWKRIKWNNLSSDRARCIWWCIVVVPSRNAHFSCATYRQARSKGNTESVTCFPNNSLLSNSSMLRKPPNIKKVPVSRNKHGMCPCSGSKIAEFNSLYQF